MLENLFIEGLIHHELTEHDVRQQYIQPKSRLWSDERKNSSKTAFYQQ
ncbi:hypothetical protein [Reichenbachiella sp. 5M10]|nr:hypothetical protein [Reichenbachiella sp. 5M10]